MAQLSSKSKLEKEGILTSFLGGLNKSLPPSSIGNDELVDATNWFYDPLTGFLTTRPGLVRYSAAALPNGAYAVSMGEYISGGNVYIVVASSDQKLYYLDATQHPVLIGALTGSQRPTYSQMNSLLVIASGGVLQTWNGPPNGLTNTTSPNENYISDFSKKSEARIVAIGNGADRIDLSGSDDGTNWTFDAGVEDQAKYFTAGYGDGMSISGIGSYRGYTFVFKRATTGRGKRLYIANIQPISSSWTCYEMTTQHTALNPYFVKELNEGLFFVDLEGPKTIIAVENLADVPIIITAPGMPNDPVNGIKIAGEIQQFITIDGFTIFDPVYQMFMVKPSENASTFYCLSFLTRKWTYWSSPLNIQCGEYVDGLMLFGATDGYVYQYSKTVDQDNGVAYQKTVETKYFKLDSLFRDVVDFVEIDYLGLMNGSMTITPKQKGSQLTNANGVFSQVSDFNQTWWTWAQVNAVTPADWTESLQKNVYATVNLNNKLPGDFVSFQIAITSGLAALSQLRGKVVAAGRS